MGKCDRGQRERLLSVRGWEIKGQPKKTFGRDDFAHLKAGGISVAAARACQSQAMAWEGEPVHTI